tara:strand:- start:427 stop:789 length:363 start_codon:yes stop_codon:yes gene_type:complete
MKHLLPVSTSQTINIIPRVYATSVTLTLRDDSSNNIDTLLITGVKSGNYIQLSSIFDLKEGRFYDLKVYNGQVAVTASDIIYRDKIFCTAQSTNQTNNEHYTVNKDEYIEKSGNNDFIIL